MLILAAAGLLILKILSKTLLIWDLTELKYITRTRDGENILNSHHPKISKELQINTTLPKQAAPTAMQQSCNYYKTTVFAYP